MILPILVAVQAMAPAHVPPPAPLFHVTGTTEALVTWRLTEVRCGGELVVPVRVEPPLAGVDWGPAAEGTTTLRFRIDADGRPLGIAPSIGYGPSRDLAPALAASSFAPGRVRTDCTADYRSTRLPIADTPVDALIGYTIFPQQRPSDALWQRVRTGGDCFTPTPALRNRAYPDFTAIPQPAATLGWSMVGYDLDPRGRPVRERVVAGTGNRDLDRASLKAVAASRFAPGARSGCLYPYWRRGAVLAAPTLPDKDAFRPEGASCPAATDWARRPVLSYPDAFRRRGIEGWAIVAFDVAPWGETGNVRVLATEPAAAFGDEAAGIVRRASAKPGPGGTGCVERVRFAMGVEGGRGQVPADAPPPPY